MTSNPNKTPDPAAADPAAEDNTYETWVAEFAAAVEKVHQGQFSEARLEFEKIAGYHQDEPVLAERAQTFMRICDAKLASAPGEPASPQEAYLRAVAMSNDGQCEESVRTLTTLIQSEPASAKYLYARASAYALMGNAEAAIGDLRQAIALEPQTRFHAVNDSDFERIREEPAFIDIIEPTPSGA